MNEQEIREFIRAAMKQPNNTQTSKQLQKRVQTKVNGKGPNKTKLQPRLDQHGKLGDFSRSNSNPISRAVRDRATIGYEEVPKTHLSQKHSDKPNKINETNNAKDADRPSLAIETEMIRKAVRIAINTSGGAPSKRAVKHMAAPKMTRPNRVFDSGNGCGVGSSRSATLGIIKAIAHPETGCIVRDRNIPLNVSQRNSNTTQGNYNPMIVE